jgi:acetolactate synthase-1/2/3 large subunit
MMALCATAIKGQTLAAQLCPQTVQSGSLSMNGATLVVKMLGAYETEHIFGVPGDTNVPLYSALEAHASQLRHVMCRDERSAGYMADAYARVSNRPGVVEVPSGGGPMYALPAVAEANMSSVPMILITSETSLMGEGRGVITELDCAKLFESITKASVQVKSAVKIPEVMRRAFRIATSGRPGAVHIAIPEDILHEEVDAKDVSLHAEPACKVYPAYRPRAAKEDLLRLHQLLNGAKRPLLVVGGGVNRSDASQALRQFTVRRGIPVVTTITGQNGIPDTHELSIGIVGDNGFHPHANRAMEEADLLVLLGCRNGSVMSIGWTFPAPRCERNVIQVDIDPGALGNNSENLLSVLGDARLVLEDLNALPEPDPSSQDPNWVPKLNGWRKRFWDQAGDQLRNVTGGVPLNPQVVITALNRRLSDISYLFSDPGTPTPYLGRFLRLENPDSRLIIPRAFGSLGYAVPAVVGCWFARPDVRPIGLFGDGSLGMSMGELETIVRLRVPAILLNFNNSCYGWIKALQRVHGHRESFSVDFSPQDYAAIATAFGIRALRIETAGELETGLNAAFAHQGPVFLDIVVESIGDKIPPVFNWLRKTGVDPLKVGKDVLV